MSKNAKNNDSIIWTLIKTGCIMVGCTAASLILINLIAAYQMTASILIGATTAVMYLK